MKKILFLLLFWSSAIYAQEWVTKMNDPSVNFYDVQKSFNKYYEEYERKNNSWLKRLFRRKEEETETPGFEVYKRWEYFNAPRVYPSGVRFNPDAAWNAYHRYKNQHNLDSKLTSGNWTAMGPSSWTSSGWNPGIGRVNVVAVDPVDSNIIYIGAPAGGLWKSTDAGLTWQQPTTDALPSIGVSAIAIDYTNPSVIYIGTGDGDGSDTYSIGVLKSTDGGTTWQQSGLSWSVGQTRNICKLLIHPTNPNILFAAARDGIYKTTDGAAHWTLVKSGSFRDIEFKPGNPDFIYAAGTSFYISADGGNYFNTISLGLPVSSNVSRLAIAVTPADSNYVYVTAGDQSTGGFYGLYKSIDGGLTFDLQSSSPNLYAYEKDGSDGGGQTFYDLTLCVSPVNPEKIYTGGVNIWTSDNGGQAWQLLTHWDYPVSPEPYVHADQHCMEFFGSMMYVGCDGGAWKSSDQGTNWTDISAGLTIMQFYNIGGCAGDPSVFMGGAQDNGGNMLSGGQWEHVIGADGMEVAVHPANTQIAYAEIYNGNLYGTTTGPANMTYISNGVSENGAWVTPFVLDPADPSSVIGGYQNVWRGDNNGTIWTQVSSFTSSSTINALAVSEADPNYIYIVKGVQVLRSSDAGNSWTNISTGIPTGLAAPTYIAIDPLNPLRLWVSCSGFSAANKVFYSPDSGATWINETGTLPNVPVNSVIYQAGSDDGIYIGTDLGVFYKDSTLSGWQPFSNGLPNVVVTEIEANYISNKIRAGTYGRGAWESDFYTVAAPPQAEFTSDKQQLCPGDSVLFSDMSLDASPIWTWSFPGGNPSSSNLRNPVVYYNATGDYDVTLTVQNSFGSDSITKNLYIHVSNPATSVLPLTEDFEAGTFPPAGWSIIDPDQAVTWQEANVGGFGNSSHSAFVQNFSHPLQGHKDYLMSPLVEPSVLTAPYLKFDVAYARIPNRPDSLAVFFTPDCGITKTYIYKKTGLQLTTAAVVNTSFTPSPTQWRSDSILLPAISGNVQFGFESTNGYGNNVYIDNINLYNGPSAVGENYLNVGVELMPNPASSFIKFKISSPLKEIYTIELYNNSGIPVLIQKVTLNETTLQLNSLPSGMYIYNLRNENGVILRAGKIVHIE